MTSRKNCPSCNYETVVPYKEVIYCGNCGLRLTKDPNYNQCKEMINEMLKTVTPSADPFKLVYEAKRIADRFKPQFTSEAIEAAKTMLSKHKIDADKELAEIKNRIEKLENKTKSLELLFGVYERIENLEKAWQREPNYVDYKGLRERIEKLEYSANNSPSLGYVHKLAALQERVQKLEAESGKHHVCDNCHHCLECDKEFKDKYGDKK